MNTNVKKKTQDAQNAGLLFMTPGVPRTNYSPKNVLITEHAKQTIH